MGSSQLLLSALQPGRLTTSEGWRRLTTSEELEARQWGGAWVVLKYFTKLFMAHFQL